MSNLETTQTYMYFRTIVWLKINTPDVGRGIFCKNVSTYNTPFTLALLIRSETGFAPLRAFTLHQLIRINNLIRIKLNHLLEVVSHRFSLLRDQITSVDANRTRTKEEQIEINARGYICIYGVACQELSRSRSSARLSTKYHCKLSVAIL